MLSIIIILLIIIIFIWIVYAPYKVKKSENTSLARVEIILEDKILIN
jgi:hypothetical protein